jgi:hypothetical protein
MIRIAISDSNLIYCQGLKTMLGQVDDFRIVVLPPESLNIQRRDNFPIDILLVDADLYLAQQGIDAGGTLPMPEVKTILLTMEPDELPGCPGKVPSIRKGSGKRDFEKMIRRISICETVNPAPQAP